MRCGGDFGRKPVYAINPDAPARGNSQEPAIRPASVSKTDLLTHDETPAWFRRAIGPQVCLCSDKRLSARLELTAWATVDCG
jgi:hypothetical protein